MKGKIRTEFPTVDDVKDNIMRQVGNPNVANPRIHNKETFHISKHRERKKNIRI